MAVSGTNSLWQDGIIDVGTLKIGSVAVTATPAELNILDTVTATAAELNYLDITSLGTGAASKAVVLDASANWTSPGSGTVAMASGSTFNVAGTFQIGGAAVTATAAEINNAADLTANLVAGGSTLAITAASHHNKTIAWDQADGSAFTLPAATGTGAKFNFVVSVKVTSNAHTLACAGADEFSGTILQTDTDTADTLASYPALDADNFDTVTMDGSTQGGLIGDWIEVIDIASGKWAIRGHFNGSGTVATPFSTS